MKTSYGLLGLLLATFMSYAPAWSADTANHDEHHPTPAVSSPAPSNNSAAMGGMSGMGQNKAAPSSASSMMANCTQHMSGIQKDLGDMIGNVDDMMKNAKTADMRKRLKAMHDQMSAMMTNMRQMQGMMGAGMMEGDMMRGGQQPISVPPTTSAPPPVAPDDHKAHHSN